MKKTILFAFCGFFILNICFSFKKETKVVREQNNSALAGITKLVSVETAQSRELAKENKIINSVQLEKPKEVYEEITIPTCISFNGETCYYNGFKSFMGYKEITSKSSRQWAFQEQCKTDEHGFRYTTKGSQKYYVIAVGTGITSEIGKRLELVLEDGRTIWCMVGDIKSDVHTDTTNKLTCVNSKNPCASEFIVDTNALDRQVSSSGNCSSIVGFGKVTSIRVYE